ncbi:MAG: CpXC domain-containing protein [Anaerolineales bacterium]
MPRTQMQCPNCRQPIVVDVQQVFDVSQDPGAKQRLLSGVPNLAQCQSCGYQGPLATPLVYHDPQKELLLTFVPAELGLPRDEQERLIGSFIQQVMKTLPQEQRKAYLLNPQTMLTYQGLVECILEADGITKEMIEAQQQRFRLIERLLQASSQDVMGEIVRQESALVDEEFFMILQRLGEAAMGTGDERALRSIVALQQYLLDTTEFGEKVKAQKQEIEAAVESLRALGDNVTREKLLDLIVESRSETRLNTLVSLTRPGLDYAFFELLSARITAAQDEEKARLEQLRTTLLEMTREIDEAMQERVGVAHRNLELLLQADDLEQAVRQNMGAFDQLFMDVVQEELQKARQAGDLGRSARLGQIIEILQKANGGEALAFLEELLGIEDPDQLTEALRQHPETATPEFVDLLTGLLAQVQEAGEKDLAARIERIFESALKLAMEAQLKG